MEKKKTKGGIFLLLVLFFVFLIGCASTITVGGKNGEHAEIPNSELKPIDSYSVGSRIKTTIRLTVGSSGGITWVSDINLIGISNITTQPRRNEIVYSTEEIPRLLARLESNKEYTVYLTVRSFGGDKYYFLDRIEGLKSMEEIEAADRARREAEQRALWAVRNPDNLDRTQYRLMNASDFSFEMVAGRLPAGSKVRFQANFLTKPTGTSYKFKEVDIGIILNSRHNFVRHLEDEHFGLASFGNLPLPQQPVILFVTVQRPGQFGEVTIDILNWTLQDRSSSPWRWVFP